MLSGIEVPDLRDKVVILALRCLLRGMKVHSFFSSAIPRLINSSLYGLPSVKTENFLVGEILMQRAVDVHGKRLWYVKDLGMLR